MKKLSDILLIILFLILALSTSAQDVYLQAGYSLTGMGMLIEGEPLEGETTMKNGMHLGLSIEIPVSKKFSIMTSAQLTTKGWNLANTHYDTYDYWYSMEKTTVSYFEDCNSYFIDFPLTFQYRIPLSWKSSIYLMAGPFIGIGLFGETKYTYSYESSGTSEPPSSYVDEGTYKMRGPFHRIDMGHTFGAGFQYKDVRLGMSYDFGLSPFVTENLAGTRALRFTLGYKLN